MKQRLGFISNSSSSSFLVIDEIDPLVKFVNIEDSYYEWKDEFLGKTARLGHGSGCVEFGWEACKYYYPGDKINFAYMQAVFYGKNPEWLSILEEVIKSHTGAKKISWQLEDDWDSKIHGYIDHQSSAKDVKNIEMFRDKTTLKNFLFSPKSYIQGGNDNE